MSLDIYLKPNELSASLLRKAIHALESAISMTTSAGDEAIAWNDSGNELFTADAQNNLLSARGMLMSALERLETSAAMMTTSSEEISEIDQVYRTDLKEWKRSGDHTKIGWQFCPAAVSTTGTTTIENESVAEDENDQSAVSTNGGTSYNGENVVGNHTEVFVDDYSSGVTAGRIRYVDQTSKIKETLRANGWGNTVDRPVGSDGHPGGQCNSACESMALSYLGIDREPGTLAPIGNDPLDGLEVASYSGEMNWQAPDGSTIRINSYGECNMTDIRNRVSLFEKDCNQGDIAPVMIRYNYSNGSGGHWLLIVGDNGDGTYNVIGPGGNGERSTTVTIDEYGNIYGDSISPGEWHGNPPYHCGVIERYAQYQRLN